MRSLSRPGEGRKRAVIMDALVVDGVHSEPRDARVGLEIYRDIPDHVLRDGPVGVVRIAPEEVNAARDHGVEHRERARLRSRPASSRDSAGSACHSAPASMLENVTGPPKVWQRVH